MKGTAIGIRNQLIEHYQFLRTDVVAAENIAALICRHCIDNSGGSFYRTTAFKDY